ncbi:transcriptional regulator, ArsR family [Rubellimicrobium thermophilum DSM 16684]|uniref:Transcriptional regulator, ArsR family n=1 Tax=Rubellimicrobium thermophilum DSM 16684 TaxID=1123069 RepID=S9R240_9RHOB|nr:transcriptional regulator, ArsR family [Rubellimicrobium thermophilum DSM 16684]
MAISALSALAQTTRLAAFRLLIRQEPEGLAAGDLARALGVPPNTLSTHLGILVRAGLVMGERRGREMRYRARLEGLRALTLFLAADCCGGDRDRCAPLVEAILTPSCPPRGCAP